MSEDYRTEQDSLGEMQVPADAYWGAQTQRAIENFPISGIAFGRRFVRALGVVKKAAAQANRDLGLVDDERADAIVAAADEVIAGEHDDQFPVDVFQTGSGTSSNMNANEVIANRAAELLGEEIGDRVVHPNDHVNYGQSSNDVIPTAMHVASLDALVNDVKPGLETLAAELDDKADAFDGVVKTGRTHLQDATPVRLGQEFGGYRTQVEKGIDRIEAVAPRLSELALGGTAVGTGLNTHPEFPETAAGYISEETGVTFREADNHFEAQAAHDAMNEAHGALRTVAGSLNKIANDLRLLASGPRNGLGEIEQPENQPGSSIMPGKINPVVAEAVNQVHKQVVGNDAAIAAGAAEGQIDLNLYKPVLAHNFLQSADMLANASAAFGEKFVAKLEANEAACEAQVERSMALATALNPTIGYDKASEVAKAALKEGKTVTEVVVEKGYLSEAEAADVLDPEGMTHRGILSGDDT
ncbi:MULTISPECIES: class II fumarate hydratase [Halobacterium]|uniref:Fumarate hydratase class II n=5 Tax=Halobacterium salinarum TaxID=2242 RepID=FUMC_HALSA|nr:MULTISPECIES: class II fumarate hydratase [Halobacterium]Q9HQ29.1 RecName: Full=Fumarate hydratase class II; Short=Fumarase C; AltName: Full=Aerobic fumarase; AltName: Full=Iron-independent fumarase [Halobacterium salinarum NRC-1]AAG19688.1 fumarate hydratase [Halobacterium salinarum NRC-1]MBB6088690.1 fumarate hydratase class II [Halobacterium salinarum]MDL0118902.1 class II fumarate hydratase [Halobacterium salinarum]MDL0122195.1 class II fumarate hydratase [Halobacterium salinarum]MDL01